MELIDISLDSLFAYLHELNSVTGEYEILKKFTPEHKEDGSAYSMYERHFSVYHALYRLKAEAGAHGFYLHIDPLRIRLLSVPSDGFCAHYDIDHGTFCMGSTSGQFCTLHYSINETVLPSFDPMAGFYLDPENISFGESEILNDIMKGFRIYFMRKKEIDEALVLFDLKKPDRKKITKRYRELAAHFHPDRCGGYEEEMKKINYSYSILKEVFVV
ncbi:MAG TPA: DNA-J related domain-containing protein [Spirochaetota bacterium]|nr:DNA-J related domain-containing protein [Spirochaetota bacterium]